MKQAIGKILVMDEEPSIRNVIKKVLTQKGFELVGAKDGVEAVALYQRAQALQQPFDVVILDLTVTFGMGAKETIKRLLKIDPNVKGIVSSGYLFDDVIVNPCKYGFCKSITKPFDTTGLLATINEAIENVDPILELNLSPKKLTIQYESSTSTG